MFIFAACDLQSVTHQLVAVSTLISPNSLTPHRIDRDMILISFYSHKISIYNIFVSEIIAYKLFHLQIFIKRFLKNTALKICNKNL